MENHNGENRSPAKLGWLLIANSIILILFSIAFVSVDIIILVSDIISDRVSFFGGFMSLVCMAILLIYMLLGIFQFWATFRRSFMACYIASIILGIIGLWPIFSIIVKFATISDNETFDILFLAAPLLIVLYLTFSIWLNLRWARRLVAETGYKKQR